MPRIPSLSQQSKQNLKDLDLFRKGKITFRRYKHSAQDMDVSIEDIKQMRQKELNVSQRVLAESIGVSVRTVQGWELGRSRPIGPARRLLHLMRKVPKVRRVLIPNRPTKNMSSGPAQK
jgi:putative transcriptional regulator